MSVSVRVLSPYEQRRLDEFERWLSREPQWIARSLDRLSSPAARALQRMVPPNTLQGALTGSDRVARRLTDERSLLHRAKVARIEDLKTTKLETCDQLATQVQRRAVLLAGGGGAVTGLAGAFGSAVDIPALLTLSLRSIHRTALCYGEQAAAQDNLTLTILALASANRQEDRLTAMRVILQLTEATESLAVESLEMAAHREFAKQSVSASISNLARQLGVNLGKRKAAGAVPILGALVSGSVNAWFVHDVCRAAQFSFLARRLTDGKSLTALTAESASV